MNINLLAEECEKELTEVYARVDSTAYKNTTKVLDIFRSNKVGAEHFGSSSGYGYNDIGRDLCDKLFADCFNAEAGFARQNITSGTHAISLALYGLMRPGDTLFSVTGKPYDTLDGVIGINGANGDGSLADYGVKFKSIELTDGKTIDFAKVREVLNTEKIKAVYLQRSKGYADRRTLSVPEIDALCDLVHGISDAYVIVDNCYGEFTEETEPKADLLAGSLIKNAGGGMAECGGYVVGTKKAVELASYRLTVPGIGIEGGASLGQNKAFIKGLFYAPHTVAQALKTMAFASLLFKKLGFDVFPDAFDKRSDIIQMLYLKNAESVIAFCEGIQSASPVDSFALPIPDDMPGYSDKVIMAAGCFAQGSSIELSADAPIREPYAVYLQGGLTYESGKYAIIKAAERMTGK